MSRILNFFDGFASATEPLQAFIKAGKLMTFATDGDYETAKGSAGETGDIYYNTTNDEIRIYTNTMWDSVSASIAFAQESPATGTIDGVNTVFTSSFIPISDTAMFIYLNGNYQEPSEYGISNDTITFVTAPPLGSSVIFHYVHEGSTPGFTPIAGVLTVDYHTITAGEVTAKQFALPSTPAEPTKTIIDIVGGTTQEYSIDFTIVGDDVDWNGLALDGVVTAGDVFRTYYFT